MSYRFLVPDREVMWVVVCGPRAAGWAGRSPSRRRPVFHPIPAIRRSSGRDAGAARQDAFWQEESREESRHRSDWIELISNSRLFQRKLVERELHASSARFQMSTPRFNNAKRRAKDRKYQTILHILRCFDWGIPYHAAQEHKSGPMYLFPEVAMFTSMAGCWVFRCSVYPTSFDNTIYNTDTYRCVR